MGFALVIRELAKRRLLLAIGALIAAIAATFSVASFHGLKLKARQLQHSSASTQVVVDTSSSFLGSTAGKLEPLNARAMIYANLLATPALLDLVGKQAGISGAQIYAAGPVDPVESIIVQEPTALKRNVQITGETKPYRLNYTANLNLPTIGINAQAPTSSQAAALANGAAVALQKYVAGLQRTNRVPPTERVTIRQLGHASGAVDNAGISKSLAGIVFLVVFALWCAILLFATRFRENWRASAVLLDEQEAQSKSATGESGEHADRAMAQRNGAHVSDPDPTMAQGAHHDDLARVPTPRVR